MTCRPTTRPLTRGAHNTASVILPARNEAVRALPRYLRAVMRSRTGPSKWNGATTVAHHGIEVGPSAAATNRNCGRQLRHGDPPGAPHAPHRIGKRASTNITGSSSTHHVTVETPRQCVRFPCRRGGKSHKLPVSGETARMSRASRSAHAGSPAPQIDLEQADGTRWSLSTALEHGPVVLVFLRGFF
jgi:hypothetical protein